LSFCARSGIHFWQRMAKTNSMKNFNCNYTRGARAKKIRDLVESMGWRLTLDQGFPVRWPMGPRFCH
jgi:hypothetical protein